MRRRELWVLGCAVCLLTGCDDGNGEPTVECDVKTYRAECRNGVARLCFDGMVKTTNCTYGCDKDSCRATPPVCEPDGGKQCDGKQPQICSNGAWMNSGDACQHACIDGECRDEIDGKCETGQKKCDGKQPQICDDGQWKNDAAPCQHECVDGECKDETDGKCETGQKKCDGKQPQICADGVWKNDGALCQHECVDGECKDETDGKCETGQKKCDGKQPQICADGVWKNDGALCQHECVDGQCALPACGSGGNVCSKNDFGSKTCKTEFKDVPPGMTAQGELVCNDDCTISTEKCFATTCGNNYHDAGEFCDIVDGQLYYESAEELTCAALNSPDCGQPGHPTCYEYEEGGFPGCSADCKALSRGTCRIKAQPMDGIQMCEFSELKYDTKTKELAAKGRITTDKGLGQASVTGEVVCTANTTMPSYEWSVGKSATRFAGECADCADDEYALVADTTLNTLPKGEYSCALRVHVNTGQASRSMYLCPLKNGYPLPEGSVPEEYIKTFQVEGSSVEGTVLAQWTFASYRKETGSNGKPITYDQFKAEDGVAADSAVLTASGEFLMYILSGTGGYGEGAAAMNDLPQDDAFSCTLEKHFTLKLNTTGYENIRLNFHAATSGAFPKTIVVAQKTANACTSLGEFDTVGGSEFVASPTINAPNAGNQTNAEIDIYTWGASDRNQTMRLDDIYITGTPIATDTP